MKQTSIVKSMQFINSAQPITTRMQIPEEIEKRNISTKLLNYQGHKRMRSPKTDNSGYESMAPVETETEWYSHNPHAARTENYDRSKLSNELHLMSSPS